MDYRTKDSGVREEFDSGMVRDTQAGKARFDLLFPLDIPYSDQLLTRAANLMERGMAKYGERNWEKANSEEERARAKASALRHMAQWINGETDEDHAAAVIFNVLAAETIALKIGPSLSSMDGASLDCKAVCPEHPEQERCWLTVGHGGLEHRHAFRSEIGRVHNWGDRPSPEISPKNLEAEIEPLITCCPVDCSSCKTGIGCSIGCRDECAAHAGG